MESKNTEHHFSLGSLVKIVSTDNYGKPLDKLGIIVTDKIVCQQSLFVTVRVYTFRDQRVRTYYPYALEVLSPA
jgi:hypothetical protein|tara:strand:+ start:1250 stop:1471 length:222 start_codon:yes stop_codon:yes gene_type:complete